MCTESKDNLPLLDIPNETPNNRKGTTKFNEDVIDAIIKTYRAKKYVGVGVGGVYIKNIDSENYILMYKRYHEPENGDLSIIGGSAMFGEEIETTLKNKFSTITGVSCEDIFIGNIITVNNHMSDGYHYLSPSFYVDIKNEDIYFYIKDTEKGKNRKHVTKIKNKKDLESTKNINSTEADPCLFFVKQKLVLQKNLENFFSVTTINAIRKHGDLEKIKSNYIVIPRIKI